MSTTIELDMVLLAHRLFAKMDASGIRIIASKCEPVPGELVHYTEMIDMIYYDSQFNKEKDRKLTLDEILENEEALNNLFSWGISNFMF